MRIRLSAVALATVGATSLAACAAQLPAGPSPAQVAAYQQADAQWRWNMMFPDERMPLVAVLEYTTPENQQDVVEICLDAAVAAIYTRPPTTAELNRASWTCAVEYPLDPAGRHQRLSPAQLAYTYAYFERRSVPCLRELGYDTFQPEHPLLESIGYPAWNPYASVTTNGDVALQQCPPPPFDFPWLA